MSIIFEHLIEDHHATPVEAKLALRAWEIKPIEHNGEIVGEVMMQNNEVHFALAKHKRKKMGRVQLMKKVLGDLLSTREFLVTRLFKNDEASKKLIEFFGFKQIKEDAEFNYFWLDKEICKCLQ